MGTNETIFIGVGLAMDAFAVAVCKGLSMGKMDWRKAIIIGLYFGTFQMMMPILGYLIGIGFNLVIEKIDHWVAFFLLSFIGIKMIKEAFGKEEKFDESVNFWPMVMLALATSIDAMAVGITYAFLNQRNVYIAFVMIGIITFILSLLGVKIGNKFGDKYGKKTEIIGGFILIIIGIKTLIEHTIFKEY